MKLLVSSRMHRKYVKKLREIADVSILRIYPKKGFPEKEFIDIASDFDGIITCNMPITGKIIQSLPKLKLLMSLNPELTHRQIDIKAATNRHIPVVLAHGAASRSVAEFTVGLILSFLYNICKGNRYIHDKRWKSSQISHLHHHARELFQKKIGIIGFGDVGKRVAYLLKAFEVDIQYYDPRLNSVAFPGVQSVTLEELLKTSDIISIHASSIQPAKVNPIIQHQDFCNMLRKPFVINTAHQGYIPTDDLIQALKEKRIRGAALDVFDEEPLPYDHILTKFENVILTPHIAGSAKEVNLLQSQIVFEELCRFTQGERPYNLANPEIYCEK